MLTGVIYMGDRINKGLEMERKRRKTRKKSEKGNLNSLRPPASTGQMCLLRPRDQTRCQTSRLTSLVVFKQQSAGGAGNRSLGTQALRDTTGNCSVPAVCPEKGEREGDPLDVKPPCPHSPVPPPGSLCSLHITPSILSPEAFWLSPSPRTRHHL